MTTLFPVHTSDSAPAGARQALDSAAKAFGFVPNLIGVMSTSPALAEAYLTLSDLFQKKTDLNTAEKQVVLLAVSRFHECRYCMAAHSLAADMQNVPGDVVEAIRNDQPIPDTRLEALRRFVTSLVEQRGWLPQAEFDAFLSAGYSPAQLLDVLVGVAQKTLSNFTNHIAATPLDQPLTARAWAPKETP